MPRATVWAFGSIADTSVQEIVGLITGAVPADAVATPNLSPAGDTRTDPGA